MYQKTFFFCYSSPEVLSTLISTRSSSFPELWLSFRFYLDSVMTSKGCTAGEQGIIGGRIDPERNFLNGVVKLVKLLQCCHLSVSLLLTGDQIEGLLNDTNANGNHL